MVSKIQHTCHASIPAPGINVLECLICLKNVRHDHSKYTAEVAEILSDLFEVLCKYMEWSPPLRYEFNFNNEVFPFCKECKLILVTLYKSHQLLADIQKQINSVISKLCGKILLSRNDQALKIRNGFTGSSQNSVLSEEIQGKRDEKVSYYRDLVDRRYSASVRVTAYAQPLSLPSPTIAVDEQDDFVASEKWNDIPDEIGGFEILRIVEYDNSEGIEAISLCNQEAKKNETTENAGVPSATTAAIHERVDFGAKEKWILVGEIGQDFEIVQVVEIGDAETTAEVISFGNDEPKEDENTENADNVKRIATCSKPPELVILEPNVVNRRDDAADLEVVESDSAESIEESSSIQETKKDEATGNATNVKQIKKQNEGSELLLLNHRRNPKRNPEKNNDQGNKRIQQSSDNEEVSSSDSPTDDSDYEPSIVSWDNESLDDDDFKKIKEPSVNNLKAHSEFQPGCSKSPDRVQTVENDASPSPPAKTNASTEKESLCNSTNDMEEDADHSFDNENIREFPQPQSFVEERRMLPSILRRSRIWNKHHKNNEAPVRKGTGGQRKSKHNSSEQHTDSSVKSKHPVKASKNEKHESQSTSNSSVAVESDERTKKVISKVTSLNPHRQDTVQDEPILESTDDDSDTDEDEVKIFEENNIFQRVEFEKRIQKIGPSRYLIDDRLSFEFVNNKWRCIPCEVEYKNKEGLREHFDKCPGNPPADSIETLKFKKYTYDKLKNGNFQCRHCKHISSSKDDVIVHLQGYPIQESGKKKLVFTNTTPDKFICNEKFSFEKVGDKCRCCECIYTCVTIKKMKEHMRAKHVYPENFECETCGKIFITKQKLVIHEKIHEVGPTLVCEICGKTLKTEQGLKTHKNNFHLDSSEKKFSCKICGKAFGIQALLNAHSKRHEHGMCEVCGKEIPYYKFKEHVASHSNIKLHECKKCGKRYQCGASLSVHMKNHDGVKPYSCDICDMKFTQQYSVTRHKNIAHNPNKPTKTIAKSRKRKLKEVSSEEEETEEENTDEDEELEEEDSEEENDSSEETSETEESL